MEVNIDAKAIEDAVVKAVVDSAIGDQVTAVIQETLTAKKSAYSSETILSAAIKSEIKRIIGEIIREELSKKKEEIRAIVHPMITDELVMDMTGAAFQVMLGKLQRA